MKQLHSQSLAIFSSLILLSACAPAQAQIQPTPTKVEVIKATNTTVPNVVATQAATSTPTETPKLVCPEINLEMDFNPPDTEDEFQEFILSYLNEGGDPTNIQGTASMAETYSVSDLSADIDGDLLPEVVVSIGGFTGDPTIIYIYHCEQNSYQLTNSFTLDSISFAEPEFIAKIFSSEPPFLILRAGHTFGWGQDFLALGWHHAQWQIINLATGSTPSEIALFDQNQDGIQEVFVKTRTAATPGGGVSRVFIDMFSWDGEQFKSTSSAIPPGPDRVHYLQDAETAWSSGNPLLAVAYYETAARDQNLSSYWTTFELTHNQTQLAKPYQQAFAFFRIVAIWFYLDRPEVAARYIEEMSEAFPKGKAGNAFVLAAQEFAKAYEIDPSFLSSCGKAAALLENQHPDIVRNHLGDWGVANPMYFASSDVCKLE